MSSTNVESQPGLTVGFGTQNPTLDISAEMEVAPQEVERGETPPTSAETSPVQKKDVPWASVHNGVDESVVASIDDIKNSCYFLFPDWKTRLTRFWMLLVLAAVIATAGVIGNSTATVIGAMIVAPLMTPIQGLMVSSVLVNRNNWLFSLFMVVTGVGTVVAIGALFGLITTETLILPKNNNQVYSRINPALPDLIAALATGMVGAISIVRKDIAGALPGVAISISLVPPLAVVGLMLRIGYNQDAAGAMLLFTTNFLCIMVTGIMTMYAYGLHRMGKVAGAKYTRTVFLVVLISLGLVAVPLYFSSSRLGAESNARVCMEDFVNYWGEPQGWRAQVVIARTVGSSLEAQVTIVGPPPFPELSDLTGEKIKEACPMVNVVEVGFFPAQFIEL